MKRPATHLLTWAIGNALAPPPPMRQQSRDALLTALSVRYLDQVQPMTVAEAMQVLANENVQGQ